MGKPEEKSARPPWLFLILLALIAGPLAALTVTYAAFLFISTCLWGAERYGFFGFMAVFLTWCITAWLICEACAAMRDWGK